MVSICPGAGYNVGHMRTVLKNILKWLPGSVLALYLAAGAVFFLWGDAHKAAIRSLIRMGAQEWDQYPLRFARGEARPDPAGMRLAARYYKTLALAMPANSQARDMTGFCYFHLNDLQRSAAFYEEAVRLAPRSLWHEYNLGVVYFRQGLWSKALPCFRHILELPVEEAQRRGVYAPLARLDAAERGRFFLQGRAFALLVREEALGMALRAYLNLKQYNEAQALTARAMLDPQIVNKKMFSLLNQALLQDRRDLFNTAFAPFLSAQDKSPVLHPWIYVIPVGKELFM
ncbi:MAG: tetratricopeptide repeat protein [Candidatus Omnitrophica bacterium]|nr:tetratricopeptide repeat protein [Candidatus Omnitrophota bacterium]